MRHRIVQSAMLAAALLLSAGIATAADKAPTTGEAGAIGKEKSAAKDDKAKKAKATANARRVDINSAGKAELKTLPGIGDAEAEKIISGRPYLSKADLFTNNILSQNGYDRVRALVIAKQNKASAAKLERLKKERATR